MTQSLTVRAVVELYLRHAAVEGIHSPDAKSDRERVFAAMVVHPLAAAVARAGAKEKVAGVVAAGMAGVTDVLGDLGVAELKPFHLTDFIEAHPGWKSVSTRRAKANYIRAAFRWAAEQGRIPCNPFVVVRYPEAERRPDFPDDLLELVCRLGNKPYERALRWLRLTACRLNELCQARWPDVDLERGIWTIHRHKSRKHTGKAKLVALVPEAVALLRQMAGTLAVPPATTGMVAEPAFPAHDGHIFLNTRGRPWTRRTLGQQLRRMKKRFNIQEKASLHGVRHRAASEAVISGAPLKFVSMMLGHSTTAVTEKYYLNLEDRMEEVRSAAASSLPKKKPERPTQAGAVAPPQPPAL